MGLSWAGLRLPSHCASQHFVVVGAPGSGKTLTVQMLMQTALPKVGEGLEHRAFVYDFKKDMLPVLAGMNLYRPDDPTSAVSILNPLDQRAVAWDIAADVQSEHAAIAVANVLFPEEKQAQTPFFRNASVGLLSGVMTSFAHNAPGRRTFRDVLLGLQSEETLRPILAACPYTESRIEQYLDCNEWPSVLSTIATKTLPFSSIAAAWSHAGRSISLTDWEKGEGILLLGADQMAGPQVDVMNRVIFQLVAQLLLNRPDDAAQGRTTWLFFDECQLGKFDSDTLSLVLAGGRSKGVGVVLGFQDIQGTRAAYGEHQADSLVNNCGNFALLRMEGEKSAAWAAEMVNKYDAEEIQFTHTESKECSNSYARQRVERYAIHPADFMQLRTPDFKTDRPFDGIYLTREYGLHRLALTPSYMIQHA